MAKNFRQVVVCAALVFLSLDARSVSAAEEVQFVFHKIAFNYQTVELRKSDGTISSAQFLSEIILLQDGRANGGFGVWEVSTNELIFYRVVEGRKIGPSYGFKAQRLSRAPASEITVRLTPTAHRTPTGSVTFSIDGGGRANGDRLNLVANGKVEQGRAPIALLDAYFTFVVVNAPPQTVEIESDTGSITSSFHNDVMVFPSVGAIGLLRLDTPGGEPIDSHYGTGVYKSTDSGRTWTFAAGLAEINGTPGDGRIISRYLLMRPHPAPTEPCRIYDILGTQVNSHSRFEAETAVTLFKFEER